jgi:hypothetical protein
VAKVRWIKLARVRKVGRVVTPCGYFAVSLLRTRNELNRALDCGLDGVDGWKAQRGFSQTARDEN